MSKEILQNIINDFNANKFTRFFREKSRTFAPIREELSQYNDEFFSNGIKLGEIQFAQDDKMLICAFEARQPLSERSGKKAQYEKGKKILKETNAGAGIFIFYSNSTLDKNPPIDSPLEKGAGGMSSFRFSLIYPEYTGTKRQWSYFKRFTYFVSPQLTNKTFLQQIGEGDFSSLKKVKEAFSVDPVTKQFYNELQYWYFWAMEKIKFPDDYKHSSEPEKDKEIRNSTNLIRLITRVVFIWFLTEKGLVPQELFSREKLSGIVRDFMKASNFYNAILQNLFFGTLNQKMDERKFVEENGYPANRKEYGVKNLYRYSDKFLISKNEVLELFKDIPFLNGGLFDCLDKGDESGKEIYVDGFSRNSAKQSSIPDYLFFQQGEERVDLSGYGLGKGRPVRGLIEILSGYNFTIDENTPVDQEIALDPELLGKVFENLLASYNPETSTTARKATGSYYTPREIVDYMVGESLIAYLITYLSSPPSQGGELKGWLPPSQGGKLNRGLPLQNTGVGEGGFDVVIGNPPYIRQEDLKPIKPILEKQGYEVYNSTSDIYTYFYEKGWQILNNTGHLTFITSNKWMRAKYGEKLRKFFKEKTELKQIIDFGGHKVFESATVDTNILVFQKNVVTDPCACPDLNGVCPDIKGQPQGVAPTGLGEHTGSPLRVLSIKSDFNHNIDLSEHFIQNAIAMNQQALDDKCFTFGDDAVMRLKKKIETIGTPLKDWDVRIYRGIITGFNEAFIIDNETKESLCKEDPKSIEVLKPILRGRDIQRYGYKWAGLWLILAKYESHKYIESRYSAIYNHLKQYEMELKNRGQCRYSRNSKSSSKEYPGQHHWLELDNNPKNHYLFLFEKG